jgi:hypothetical protein
MVGSEKRQDHTADWFGRQRSVGFAAAALDCLRTLRRNHSAAKATKWNHEKYHHGNGETKSANNCHVEKREPYVKLRTVAAIQERQRKGHIEWNGDLVEPQIPAAGCAGRSPNFDNGPREYPRRAEWNKKPTDSPVAGITPVEEGHDCQRKHHRCNALCARDLPPKARNRAFSFCSGHGYLPTGGAACVIVRFERHDSSRWLLAGEALEVGHLLFHFFAGGVGGGADALDA